VPITRNSNHESTIATGETIKFESRPRCSSRSGLRAKGPDVIKAVTKPSDRKFKVGDEDDCRGSDHGSVVGDQVRHRKLDIKKTPLGRVLVEDAEGKVIVRLTAYGRGKVRGEKGTPHLACIARIRRRESSTPEFFYWRYLRREG